MYFINFLFNVSLQPKTAKLKIEPIAPNIKTESICKIWLYSIINGINKVDETETAYTKPIPIALI